MTQPTPAIVAQSAVRRLPRLALLLFCIAYVLPGFFGREPWKNVDMMSFGYMLELAQGHANWFQPSLQGLAPDIEALVPYWLGAWAMQWAPAFVAPDFAARIPFGLLLTLTLIATWYAVYYLARSPSAQPVAFAFGGEAQPADYARAMADGGLLALVACLGLAQLSHETTPALAQLGFAALTFFALAAMPYRLVVPAIGVAFGLIGLALSGAPAMAAWLGLGGSVITVLDRHERRTLASQATGWAPLETPSDYRSLGWTAYVLAVTAIASSLAWYWNQWIWRIDLPHATWRDWGSLCRLVLWFVWPVWPLALWTLWRWRKQLVSGNLGRHLMLPLLFVAVGLGTTITTHSADRSLLLALPALATLAAFALPTLSRTVAAAIDWFTLLFFTVAGIGIWVIWIAMQTGFPKQPAANVAKLAPGFTPTFSLFTFLVALVATLSWAWLVKWRVGRHRSAIWKSLVLPAGGTALCWLLLTTLWMPVLDFARSYAPMVRHIVPVIQAEAPQSCVEQFGLDRGQIAAFQFHGSLRTRPAQRQAQCEWMLVDPADLSLLPQHVDMSQWKLRVNLKRRMETNDDMQLYRRARP